VTCELQVTELDALPLKIRGSSLNSETRHSPSTRPGDQRPFGIWR